MPELIKNGRIVADDWQIVLQTVLQTVSPTEDETPEAVNLPAGKIIVPLAVWRARRDELAARPDTGVWLTSSDDPADIANDVARLPVIAIHFPKFADGRGYSTATLLRSRYGFTGELRATGEVLRDQFNYLSRCGFDALQPAEGRYTRAQLASTLASLADFTDPYQASITPAEPLFHRARRAA